MNEPLSFSFWVCAVKLTCNRSESESPPYPPTEGRGEVTHRDIHTVHRYKYIPPNKHVYTKSQAHRRDGGCSVIKGREQMPTCSLWTWPCRGSATVPRVAPGCLNTLFPSVAWKVKGRDVQVHGYYPPPLTLSLFLCQPSLSQPAISGASTYQSAVRGKLYIIGITQCLKSSLPAITPTKQSVQLSADRPVLCI